MFFDFLPVQISRGGRDMFVKVDLEAEHDTKEARGVV